MATVKFTAKAPTEFVVVYTKEPWEFMSETPTRVVIDVPLETPWYSDAFEGGEQEAEAVGNAYRIVACVNACAGLPDPAENIKELVEAAKAINFFMSDPIDCGCNRCRAEKRLAKARVPFEEKTKGDTNV